MSERDELREILRSRSVMKGEFTLVSGRRSSYYINGKMTTLHSRGLYLASKLILDALEGTDYDAFAGPTIGADPLIGSLLTLAAERGLEKEGLLIRKEVKGHGTQRLVEGNLTAGARAVILEDVATTGGSLLRAARAVLDGGGAIAGIHVLIDREEGAAAAIAEAGFPFNAVFSVKELL